MAKVEALAAGHRADFERERERFDGLMAEQSVHHGCTVEGERSQFQRPIFRAPLRTVFIADANMPGDFFFRLLVAVFFADFFALRAILNLPLFPKFSSGTIR